MNYASLRAIIQGLSHVGMRYFAAGDLAVVAHGCMPNWVDVELFVRRDEGNLAAGLAALEILGFRTINLGSPIEMANLRRRGEAAEDRGVRGIRVRSELHPSVAVDFVACDVCEFDAEFQRVVWFEMAGGLRVPVCGYEDLVRFKRLSGRAMDALDMEALEIARSQAVPDDDDPWATATFEGNRRQQLRRWAALPFDKKLVGMEESYRVCLMFVEARRKMGLASMYRDGRVEK